MTAESESTADCAPPLMRRHIIVLMLSAFCVVLMLPTPQGMLPEAHRLAAVTLLMAGLWVTQAIPLAATSLIPLVLFPVLGIQSATAVSKAYMNDKVFLYMGGFIIALGIERWQLHRRIALNIVNVVGAGPRQLVLGFMIATGGLSMWISNTATTLLMLPIALALLKTMEEEADPASGQTSVSAGALAVPLLLSIAYSASLGGLTTIVGTPTNSTAVGIYSEMLPTAPEISVAGWMLATVPVGVLYLAVAWVVLTWKLPRKTRHDNTLHKQLRTRLTQLGPITPAEARVAAVFAATALLWITRRPLLIGSFQLLPGWSELLPGWYEWLGVSAERAQGLTGLVNDSTVAMGMAVLLFLMPSGQQTPEGLPVRLMDWDTAGGLPWDIMLLFGGGFALAGAFDADVTDLAGWMGRALETPLTGQPAWVVVAVTCAVMTFLTEFTSNVATISTVLPAMLAMSEALGLDPRMLMVPATLATSCAFMLPIATPPNAIVFGSGRIPVQAMARYGVLLNLLGVPILTAATWLLIRPLMNIP